MTHYWPLLPTTHPEYYLLCALLICIVLLITAACSILSCLYTQALLPLHTDESMYSLTLTLNSSDEYVGGGTYFGEIHAALRPTAGHVIAFEGAWGGDGIGRRVVVWGDRGWGWIRRVGVCVWWGGVGGRLGEVKCDVGSGGGLKLGGVRWGSGIGQCGIGVIAMCLLCDCWVIAMRLLCACYVIAM